MAAVGAKRYARAAFELAQEAGDLDGWIRRLETVRMLVGHPEVRAVVTNPTIPVIQRQELVESIAPESLGQEGVNLAKLLVASGRVDWIDDIVDEFERLADEATGRVRATVTAAIELEPGEMARLRAQLASKLGREVRLQVQVDPGVLGGLTIRYGDRLVDVSVASRLQQLRRALAGA
jgi:F-type H+-transporting ATPase subunit delta